jgi:hypothetical protein
LQLLLSSIAHHRQIRLLPNGNFTNLLRRRSRRLHIVTVHLSYDVAALQSSPIRGSAARKSRHAHSLATVLDQPYPDLATLLSIR